MNNEIVIIGTGGHAKVIIDIVNIQGKYTVRGCISSTQEKSFCGIPIIGSDESSRQIIDQYGVNKAFIAIGDNAKRKNLSEYYVKLGFELVTLIHPSAVVSNTAIIGDGVVLMPGVVINTHAKIMHGSIINTNTSIDHDCIIESYVHIGPTSGLAGNVTVREGTFLGIGSTVIPKITIGSWCVSGAGSVIVSDVPDNVLLYGVPARIKQKD